LAEKRRFNEGIFDDKEASVDAGVAFEPPPPPPPEEETEEGDMMGLRKGFGLMDDEAEKVAIGDVGAPEEEEDEVGPEKPKDVDMDRWRGSEIESGAVFVVLSLV
jgi:hypothetical protein